jgi:hypothetical protein
MTTYDISIANCAVKLDSALGLASDASLLVRDGLIRVALPLVDARRALLKFRELGGSAYLVPVEYRNPVISLFAAREIVRRLHAQMLAAGRDLEDIGEGRDDLLWWTFRAKDRELISRDVIPGCVTISVDQLDGHIRTDEEYRAWLELSKVT